MSLIILIVTIALSSICFAEGFETDSRSMYTELRHMGMNFDIGINYIGFKDEFRKLYQSYNDYAEKYPNYGLEVIPSDPNGAAEKKIYDNVTSCFNIYKAVNLIWSDNISSHSYGMKKVGWMWDEFPALDVLHRDWLGSYDSNKAMRIILGYRAEKETNVLNSIDARYVKK